MSKIIVYIIYVIDNIIYLFLSLYALLFINTYWNGFLIPDSLLWKNGLPRKDLFEFGFVQTIILTIEEIVFAIILFFINKHFLLKNTATNNINKIARLTSGIYFIFIVVLIIIFCICISLKG